MQKVAVGKYNNFSKLLSDVLFNKTGPCTELVEVTILSNITKCIKNELDLSH